MNNRIGICGRSYPSQRMIIGKINNSEYIDLKQKNILFVYFLLAIGKIVPSFRVNSLYAKYVHFHLNAFRNETINYLHLFNRICINDYYKWVVTFEKTLPEYFSGESELDIKALTQQAKYLLKNNCKYILPMSYWAKDYNTWLLKHLLAENEVMDILRKTQVLYPPQPLLVTENEIGEKYKQIESKNLTFIYVGSQVKRKGGVILLKVLHKLSIKYSFSLFFIGNLDNGYNNYFLSEKERKECEKIIENEEWIYYFNTLPNEEVLKLMRSADIGLLPTIGDTFGFSVLEMQASGCPVITTNREAMPEINNTETGWIIDTKSLNVPNGDDYGNYTKEEIALFEGRIAEQLETIIIDILDNRKEILNKAIKSFQKVKQDNSPDFYCRELSKIYLDVVSNGE